MNDHPATVRRTVPTGVRKGPIAYSLAEAADVLGVTRQTINNLMKRGVLTRYKVGRSTRASIAEVHALVGYEATTGDAA